MRKTEMYVCELSIFDIQSNNAIRSLFFKFKEGGMDMFKIKLGGGKTAEVEESMYWHTTSHIMAQAVKRLFPEAKLAIGPAIENGFYYDFDVEKPFSEEDLRAIEEEMKKISKENLELERFELPREEAIKLMKEKNENYKVELIEDLKERRSNFFLQTRRIYRPLQRASLAINWSS